MTDLSTHVAANEVCQNQGEASSTTSLSTSLPTQRAPHQGVPAPNLDVPEEVHRSMAKRMRQVTAYTGATTERDISDDEEELAPRWQKHLKSGLQRTGDTTVLNKVTWPQEVVYTLAGTPTT